MNLQPARSIATCLSVLFILLVGCGSEPAGPPESTPENLISTKVNSVPDMAMIPAEFAKLFVDGQIPAGYSPKSYAPLTCEAKSVEIEGDTATVQVAITKTGAEVSDAESVPTSEWTLVKQGEDWKIKTAPLPNSNS